MKIKEGQYKQTCAKCEYLQRVGGRRVCPFTGCIKQENDFSLNHDTEDVKWYSHKEVFKAPIKKG